MFSDAALQIPTRHTSSTRSSSFRQFRSEGRTANHTHSYDFYDNKSPTRCHGPPQTLLSCRTKAETRSILTCFDLSVTNPFQHNAKGLLEHSCHAKPTKPRVISACFGLSATNRRQPICMQTPLNRHGPKGFVINGSTSLLSCQGPLRFSHNHVVTVTKRSLL